MKINNQFNLTKPPMSVILLKYCMIFFISLLTISISSCVSRPILPTSTNETALNSPSASSAPSENETAADTSTNETSAIPEPNNDILQIFSKGELISNGVAIGDGSYVATVLYYVDREYLPGGVLDVVTSKGERFSASIQVLDPRTSATLLKLQNGKIAPVRLINSSEIYDGQQIILWGWHQSLSYTTHNQAIYGEPELIKISASSRGPYGSPPRISVIPTPPDTGFPFTLHQDLTGHSIVTNVEGDVLGIRGVYFTLRATQRGIPSVLATENFLNLFSSDTMQQPWINGPVSFYYLSAYADAPSDYTDYALALNQSFTKVGKPLTLEEAKNALFAKNDRLRLTAVYAFPVNLRNSAGDVLAQARWIEIEWRRTEEPAYLIYGNIYPDVLGGFQLEGDIYSLMRSHGFN